MKCIVTDCGTRSHWYDKSEIAEKDTLAEIELEMIHVDLNSGQKHEIKYSYFTENLKAAVAVEDVKPIRTDNHTGDNHAHDVRNPEPVQ